MQVGPGPAIIGAVTGPVVLDGKYELVEMAGEGGMASVWKAQVKGAAGFSRTVAIKKIKSEFRSIKNYTEMFIEEARVGSELAHPNIVQVYDFCVDPQGTYYIVMELSLIHISEPTRPY